MPSRRFHQKRRHGCANCKRRKTRCGEERPSCQNCIRLSSRCSFRDSDQQEGSVIQCTLNPSPKRIGMQTQFSTGNVEPQHAELMTHYFSTACFTATDEAQLWTVWQTTIPTLALSSSYLNHALLAFSAMNMRLTSSPCRQPFFTALARQHLSQALCSYIPQLGRNTEQSCPALFAFSAILPAVSFSLLQSDECHLEGEDYIKQFIKIRNFLVGATLVAKNAKQWIRSSCVSPLLALRSLENVLPHVADNPRVALQALLEQIRLYDSKTQKPQTHIDPLSGETESGSVYESSVEVLSNTFPSINGQPPRLGAVLGWPVFVDQDFFRLLSQNDPIALVILAYYGAALHSLSNIWWLQNLGARLVKAVCQIVGSKSSSLFQWPLAQTSGLV